MIDTAAKRRSAAGVPCLPQGPGVTPDAGKPIAWRQQSAWGYSGIAAGSGSAASRSILTGGASRSAALTASASRSSAPTATASRSNTLTASASLTEED